MSNGIARIYFAKPTAGMSTLPGGITSADGLAPASGRVRVPATAGWVNTGLTVSEGQTLLFNTTGEVRLSAASDDVAGPAGSKKGRYAGNGPIPSSLAGALIGRIGNGAPFGIGNQTSIPALGTGVLWLGVNDDSWPTTPASSASTSRRRRGVGNAGALRSRYKRRSLLSRRAPRCRSGDRGARFARGGASCTLGGGCT